MQLSAIQLVSAAPGQFFQLPGELILNRYSGFERNAIEPGIRLRRILAERPHAADPAALVGNRGAHRETLRQRRRLRGAVEPAVGREIGRHRDVGFLGAGPPRALLDQAGQRAGVFRVAGFSLFQRGHRDGVASRQQAALGIIGLITERCKHRGAVDPFRLRRGSRHVVSEAGRQGVVFQHADLLDRALSPAARRSTRRALAY